MRIPHHRGLRKETKHQNEHTQKKGSMNADTKLKLLEMDKAVKEMEMDIPECKDNELKNGIKMPDSPKPPPCDNQYCDAPSTREIHNRHLCRSCLEVYAMGINYQREQMRSLNTVCKTIQGVLSDIAAEAKDAKQRIALQALPEMMEKARKENLTP